MDAITLLTDGSMKAVGMILAERPNGLANEVDQIMGMGDAKYRVLTDTLRAVMKEEIEGIMDEWKQGIESSLGDAWLRELLNAQCNQVAIEAVKRAAA